MRQLEPRRESSVSVGREPRPNRIDVANLCNGLSQAASDTVKSLPLRRRRGGMVYFIVDLEIMVLLSLVMVEFRSSYSVVVVWGLVSCNSLATTDHNRKAS
jgi:hypothetical protein